MPGPRVLVVDDNELNLELAQYVLEADGFVVDRALHVDEAWARLRALPARRGPHRHPAARHATASPSRTRSRPRPAWPASPSSPSPPTPCRATSSASCAAGCDGYLSQAHRRAQRCRHGSELPRKPKICAWAAPKIAGRHAPSPLRIQPDLPARCSAAARCARTTPSATNGMLMVASDRLSAFDVIMGEPIPGKGALLTTMALFWFDKLQGIVPNHLTGEDPLVRRHCPPRRAQLRGPHDARQAPQAPAHRGRRARLSRRQRLGGVPGQNGSVCGVALPAGLRNADKLPAPIFTPATKAEMGDHDENISFEQAAALIGDRPRHPRARHLHPALPARRRLRADQGHHHCRHQVRVRPGLRTAR